MINSEVMIGTGLRITASKDELSSKLSLVARGVSSRTAVLVLGGIQLRAEGEHWEAARRHAEYYRDIFAPAEAESESRTQAEWLAVYGRHIDNVRASLDWAFSPDGDVEIGAALTAAAVPLWVQLSLLAECRERTELALARLDETAGDAPKLRMQLSAADGILAKI